MYPGVDEMLPVELLETDEGPTATAPPDDDEDDYEEDDDQVVRDDEADS